jgi:hypothetical protein
LASAPSETDRRGLLLGAGFLADERRAIPSPFVDIGIVGVGFSKIKQTIGSKIKSPQTIIQAGLTHRSSSPFHSLSPADRTAAQISVFVDKNVHDQ